MQDLLAGLTATLVMFLPRYGAFLAAGALLRWLIRKEQKPWYLTVALLALGILCYLFLGQDELWMVLIVAMASLLAAIGSALCGMILWAIRAIKRKKTNSAGHPSWVHLRAKSRATPGCAPKRPAGQPRIPFLPVFLHFRVYRQSDASRVRAGHGMHFLLISPPRFRPPASPGPPLPVPCGAAPGWRRPSGYLP